MTYVFSVLCPYCGKSYKQRGLQGHITKAMLHEIEVKQFRTKREIPTDSLVHLKSLETNTPTHAK